MHSPHAKDTAGPQLSKGFSWPASLSHFQKWQEHTPNGSRTLGNRKRAELGASSSLDAWRVELGQERSSTNLEGYCVYRDLRGYPLDKASSVSRKTASAVGLPSPTIRNRLKQAFKVSDSLMGWDHVLDHNIACLPPSHPMPGALDYLKKVWYN